MEIIDNKATGFIGGFTGKFITDTRRRRNLSHFVEVEEDTRINVKIKADAETKLMDPALISLT